MVQFFYGGNGTSLITGTQEGYIMGVLEHLKLCPISFIGLFSSVIMPSLNQNKVFRPFLIVNQLSAIICPFKVSLE
jgi:hypothetical protein